MSLVALSQRLLTMICTRITGKLPSFNLGMQIYIHSLIISCLPVKLPDQRQGRLLGVVQQIEQSGQGSLDYLHFQLGLGLGVVIAGLLLLARRPRGLIRCQLGLVLVVGVGCGLADGQHQSRGVHSSQINRLARSPPLCHC